MKHLNKKQLAFILDIKVEDARAMMCNAWEKSKGIEKVGDSKEFIKGAERTATGKVEDKYPVDISIEILSTNLNLPHLQAAVDDICNNYLTRQGSKKYILFDFPEKEIRLQTEKGKHTILKIPPTLRSMLPEETKEQIRQFWLQRYQGKTVSIA